MPAGRLVAVTTTSSSIWANELTGRAMEAAATDAASRFLGRNALIIFSLVEFLCGAIEVGAIVSIRSGAI